MTRKEGKKWTTSFCLYHPISQASTSQRWEGTHQLERKSRIRDQPPRPLGSHTEDPPTFHLIQRSAKLKLQRWIGIRKKHRGYQYQSHSRSHCGSQWPALHTTPASFATEETNGPHSHHNSLPNSPISTLQVFAFTITSHSGLSLYTHTNIHKHKRAHAQPPPKPGIHTCSPRRPLWLHG